MRFFGVLNLLIGVCLVWGQTNVLAPVEIQDPYFLKKVLLLLPDTSSDMSAHWALVPALDTSGQTVVLCNGTEVFRLTQEQSEDLLSEHPDFFSQYQPPKEKTWKPPLVGQKTSWEGLKKASWDDLSGPWYGYQEGLDLHWGVYMPRGERWWIRNYFGADFSRIWTAWRFEVGVDYYQDYMNLQQYIRLYEGNDQFSNWSWHGKVVWKWLSWKVEQAGWVLPEYFWMEKDVEDLYVQWARQEEDTVSSRVIKQFRDGFESSHSMNLAHTLGLRLWYFRYALLVDSDAYLAPVHRFAWEEFPTGFGKAGITLVGCKKVWVPGVWLEFGPLFSFSTGLDSLWKTVHVIPLRVSFQYHNTSHFAFRLQSTIHWGSL